MLLQTELNKQD